MLDGTAAVDTAYVSFAELEMIDDCHINWGVDVDNQETPQNLPPLPICEHPSEHSFVKKQLAISNYRECSKCGFSPELDGHKEEFKEHSERLADWERFSKEIDFLFKK